MSDGTERPNHLFIVRLWREPGLGGDGPWRGSVQHVASGRRRYYSTMVDLTEFISARLVGFQEEGPEHTIDE